MKKSLFLFLFLLISPAFAEVEELPSGDYTGLSSDTKPADADAGDTFFEYNTRRTFVYTGSVWIQVRQSVVQVPHDEIHQGNFYRVVDVIDLSNAQVYKYQVTTVGAVHLRLTHVSENEIDVQIFENPTSVSGGSALTAYNRNRMSSNTTDLTVREGVTASGGTLIDWEHHGSGRQAGGADEDDLEWMLKAGEDYIIQVTNGTTSANQFSLRIQWYE